MQVMAAKAGRHGDGDNLYLVVKPSGAASWQLRYAIDGRRRDFGLGSRNDYSLAEARERAAEARKLVRAGVHPIEARKLSRVAPAVIPTFRDAAVTLHGERKDQWENAKHRDQWLSTLKTYVFPAIGNRTVDAVTAGDVRDLLLPIWQAKPETARRVLQRVCAVLDWAYSKGHRLGEAPLRTIRIGLGPQ